MQIRRVALAVGLVLALALAGCATAPPAGSGADLASPTVPAGVNLSEWREVEGGGVMTVTPAFSYATLQELADASELVVTGTVVEQHPFPDHDLITTESIIEVTEVIKGTLSPGTLRLYTIGTPVYLPEHLDVDGVGDPPLFDKTYVMFLTPLPELTNAVGNLVPVRGVWTAIGSGQYAQNSDGTLHWDGDSPGGDSGPEPVVTMDKVRSVSIG